MKYFIYFCLLLVYPFFLHGESMQQKVVLITGCSSGIGFHTATYLCDKNYKVYAGLLDLQQDSDKLKNGTINPQGLVPLKLDISSREDIQGAVKRIIDQEGHIDILINNAAYGLFGPVDACTMEEIEQQFRVNLFGTIELTHAVIPYFRKQSSGRIICISSLRAFKSSSVQGVYSATKSALEAIGASWASTLFPWNIHVTLVEPGATATSFPSNMVFGSFYQNQDDPYPNIIENSLAVVHAWNNDEHKAQNPREIAFLIDRVLTCEKPPLRIQTNANAQEEVERFSKDPTGDIWLKEEIKLVREWSLLK
jgi:NAD(P)-dependent dehydrogenase (short-subunit alcohol dehydrogenase family)